MSKINHNDKQTSHLIDNIEKTATTFAEKGIFVHTSSKSKHLNLELPNCVSGKCRWKPYTMGLNSKKNHPLVKCGYAAHVTGFWSSAEFSVSPEIDSI